MTVTIQGKLLLGSAVTFEPADAVELSDVKVTTSGVTLKVKAKKATTATKVTVT